MDQEIEIFFKKQRNIELATWQVDGQLSYQLQCPVGSTAVWVYVRVIWVQATEIDWQIHGSSGSQENKRCKECLLKGGGRGNMIEEGMFQLKHEKEAEA